MPDRFLKLGDVAEMFAVSRSTVWRWHAERGLKIVSVGGVTRVRETDLQAFVARHEAGGASRALADTDAGKVQVP